MPLSQQLKTHFGFDTFREGQQPVVEKLLAGQSAIAIFPTGSGKSLCYQFTATQLPHLTLVVSPLLALIKDQLGFLRRHGVAAASLDSTLSYEAYVEVTQAVRQNKLKILMVSVERFKNESFRRLLKQTRISLLVIDEAHCISEWGHNFRPDYLKLPAYQKAFDIPQTLLLTATATSKVKADMAAKFAIADDAIVQTGFYRPNLNLQVLPVAEVTKLSRLVQLINQQGSVTGIVYVTLQHTAERVAAYLQRAGVDAKAYHAGLLHEHRQQVQDEFMQGITPVVVATIAFGMGVDKAAIRFVVHFDLPKSIENYSQEIGRAGRDNQAANCYVLGNLATVNTLENFIYGDTPEQWGIEVVLDRIKNRPQPDWEVKLQTLVNDSNIRQLTMKTLLVKLEQAGVIKPKYRYIADYQIQLRVDRQTLINTFQGERRDFIQALLAATNFKKVWGLVDFDALYQRYGEQGLRQRAVKAIGYLEEKRLIQLKTSGSVDVYAVNAQFDQADSTELVQHLYNEFKTHEHTEIERINKLLAFLQSEHCLSHELACYFDDPQAPTECGHCSVCLNRPTVLLAEPHKAIEPQRLHCVAKQLKKHLSNAGFKRCSAELVTRFLIGINMPIFTVTRAKRSLDGFGLAESMRYADVLQLLEA